MMIETLTDEFAAWGCRGAKVIVIGGLTGSSASGVGDFLVQGHVHKQFFFLLSRFTTRLCSLDCREQQ